MEELEDFGDLDASNEDKYSVANGLEHKYQDTALLLLNDICGGYCRFCFRKRLFMDGNDDTINDITEAMKYIKNNTQIRTVLLTGGDPLVIGNKKLLKTLEELAGIEHLTAIRIGTKMLAFNPFRFQDKDLLKGLSQINLKKKIYIMGHFNHVNEISPEAVESARGLLGAGLTIFNQTPIIRDVNDTKEAITNLLTKLTKIGIVPYYFFQMRPTVGNKSFGVPIEETIDLLNDAYDGLPGISKNIKFVMSHETGKIEVIGKSDDKVILKYHRNHDKENANKIMIFQSNKEAYWLEDYLS